MSIWVLSNDFFRVKLKNILRSMNDNDGPLIARTIYEEIFKDPTASLDPEMIPYALDCAIQKLQQNGVHPSRWATYIHVGI